ncbi:hypothetical protein KDH_29960 [Dictyobacter sp. S3.2.2.5]|uniref:Uncharacterized protein n=1 Tax=Dictyobacter halimunensis TaxID=3026934 RepID=A0ABQ6FUP3_9CHLR|nr:hypothetical protein KDH_29960 [Dictyobacter sp. S3.2.2.5]
MFTRKIAGITSTIHLKEYAKYIPMDDVSRPFSAYAIQKAGPGDLSGWAVFLSLSYDNARRYRKKEEAILACA